MTEYLTGPRRLPPGFDRDGHLARLDVDGFTIVKDYLSEDQLAQFREGLSHSARAPPERHAPAASPSVLGSAFLQPGSANGRLALQTIENRVRPSERIGQFMN